MKRIVSLLLTLSLLLSLAPFAFATDTELTEVDTFEEVGSYPLDLPYDSEFFAPVGSEIDPKTYLGSPERNAYFLGLGKNGLGGMNITLNEDYFSTFKVAEATGDAAAAGANDMKSAELKADLAFDLARSKAKFADNYGDAKTLDAIYRWPSDGKGTITANASQRPSDRIIVAYTTGNNFASITLTLNYTDGTVAEKNFTPKGYYNAWGTTHWKNYIGYKVPTYRKYRANESNIVTNDTSIADAENAIMLSFVEVDPGKIIKTIGIGGNEDGNKNGTAIFAMTEMALTNAELQNIVNAINIDTASNEEILYAKECVKELKLRGDITDYSAIENKEILDIVYDYRLALPFNADMIASTNETVDESWLRDPVYRAYIEACGDQNFGRMVNGINAKVENLFKNGIINYEGHKNSTFSEDFDKNINFNVSEESLKATKLDALTVFTENKVTVDGVELTAEADPARTIQASQRPSDALYFLFRGVASSATSTITLNYTDGTSENVTLKFQRATDSKVDADAGADNRVEAKLWMGYGSVKADSTNTVVSGGTTDNSMLIKKLNLAPNKVLKDFTIGAAQNASFAIYGITEGALSEKALLEGVAKLSTDADVIFAKACADELVLRGSNASKYQNVYDLYEKLQYRLEGDNPEFIYADLTSKFDADMFAYIGDDAGENWVGGLTENGRFAALNSANIPHTNGIVTNNNDVNDYSNCEIIYDADGKTILNFKSADGTLKAADSKPTPAKVSRKVNFQLSVDGFDGDVNDAIDLRTETTVELSGRPLSEIWFAFGVSNPGYIVYNLSAEYADGTTGTIKVSPSNITNVMYYDGGSHVEKWLNNDYITYLKGGASWAVVKNAETGVVEAPASFSTDGIGLTIIGEKIANKGIKKLTFPAQAQVLLAAITEIPVATETLEAYVNEVAAMPYVANLADTDKVMLAKEYADELVKRHILKTTDSTYAAIQNLLPQAEANSFKHIDISEYLDADVIVPVGEDVPEDYEGRFDSYINDKGEEKGVGYNGLINAAGIPVSGIVKMNEPSKKTVENHSYLEYGKLLTDATFKLSGGYKDFGRDAVVVSNTDNDGVTIKFSDAEKGKYKDFYFLFESPRGEQTTPFSTKVKINYTDGTSTEARTNIHYNTSYYAPDLFANYGIGSKRVDIEDNKTKIGSSDGSYLKASGINYETRTQDAETGEYSFTYPEIDFKDVESITFSSISNATYSILAVTAVPYTTEELNDLWSTALGEFYSETGIVVGTNDEAIEEGAYAAIELYEERKATVLVDETSYAIAKEMITAVYNARQLDDKEFEAVVDVIVENGKVKASAAVTNGVNVDKWAVLVVAVYGENNKLLNLNVSESQKFSYGDINKPMEVSCDDVEGAVSYNAFVWESLDSLRAIAIGER